MRRAFADTFFFLAALNPRDPSHRRALDLRQTREIHCVTTEWVLTEVADALSQSPNRPVAVGFLRGIGTQGSVTVLPASADLFRRGTDLFASRMDKDRSLTDCISFVAMHDEGLTDALTGDHHFEQAGFIALFR